MENLEIKAWPRLQKWLEGYEDGQQQFAFRGQADYEWHLRTSLARHFLANRVGAREWRKRELKMYCGFRERLLATCGGIHKEWTPLEILSLMQHHGAPTRLIDFTYDPKVAAYFALEDSRGDSAIWVVDRESLEERRKKKGLLDYCGPEHRGGYRVFDKDPEGKYRLVGSIMNPKNTNDRLAAQKGCFLVPGSIAKFVSNELVHTKVKLSKDLVLKSLKHLKDQGYDRERFFPNLEQLAKDAKRFSVVNGVGCPGCQ